MKKIIELFKDWRWNLKYRKVRKEIARTQRRVRRYGVLTIKSWENIELKYQKDHRWPRAVAAVDEGNWFGVAINCMRDGQMGMQDEDGVYERLWGSDEAGNIDLRNATPEEADLYLKKVEMRDVLICAMDSGECKRGTISVLRLNGVTYIIYPQK